MSKSNKDYVTRQVDCYITEYGSKEEIKMHLELKKLALLNKNQFLKKYRYS